MEWLSNLLLLVQVIAALGVIVLVLLQHGKGADMGAAFGSGSSGSLFGATGSANFLSRSTAACAAIFFVTTLGLAFVSHSDPAQPRSVMEGVVVPPPPGGIPNDVPGGTAAPSSGAGDANSQIPATTVPQTGQPSDVPK